MVISRNPLSRAAAVAFAVASTAAGILLPGSPATAAPEPAAALAGTGGVAVLANGREVVADEVVVSYEERRGARVVELGARTSVREGLSELRSDPDVRWAEPNAVARASGLPNDPGRAGRPGGWVEDQWNFLAPPAAGEPCTVSQPCGVDAIEAWRLLRQSHTPGGRRRNGRRGPIVAVVDTGVAYRDAGRRFRRNPDFDRRAFVQGHDFVAGNDRPLDRNGHGTHVAATIIEQTNNGRAVTGLAPGLRVMPVRVLDSSGAGTADDVARGIRFATREGAKVINLSLEFGPGFRDCKGLRPVCRAVRKAQRKGVMVVAATGNGRLRRAQMPAKIATGVAAGTIRGCLSRFSSAGRGTDITAPGGGRDQAGAGPQCQPSASGPSVVQLTLTRSRRSYRNFGYPRFEGSSMSTPHVSAAAALVQVSGVLRRKLGRAPRPGDIENWLQCTARQPEGDAETRSLYGAGLLDLAAALDERSSCPSVTG